MLADCFCLPTHYDTLGEAIGVIIFCIVIILIAAKEIIFPKDED